jgi:hypothetical protein
MRLRIVPESSGSKAEKRQRGDGRWKMRRLFLGSDKTLMGAWRRSLTDRLIYREPRSCHDTDIRPGTELRRRSVPKPAP